jgi:transposase
VALVDALGNLVRFILLPGQRHDSVGVAPLITDIEFAALIADKAFDNNALRTELIERSALAVIPPRAIARCPFRTMSKCTNGGISSKIASNRSRSSVASLRATTRQTPASPQPLTSWPPSSHFDECLQSLVHWR